MTDMTLPQSDSRARRNVMVLIAAQAVLGSQMPMIFIVGGLAGQSLASNICFATLPITLIVMGSMLAASPMAAIMQKFAGMALLATPILIPLTHSPIIGILMFTAGFIAMGVPVIIHLSTLPVELDASFNHALPLLKEGEYLNAADQKAAKTILLACAMTYVAASLSSLFNLWKWFKTIKR